MPVQGAQPGPTFSRRSPVENWVYAFVLLHKTVCLPRSMVLVKLVTGCAGMWGTCNTLGLCLASVTSKRKCQQLLLVANSII